MLHTSVLLSVAVLSVAAFVPPNYYNYAIQPEAPGNQGGPGPQGNGNYAIGQHGFQIQPNNSATGIVITRDDKGNIRITKKDGKIVITNCRVCRLCCVGYRIPGPGGQGESDKYSIGPNQSGTPENPQNPQNPGRYVIPPFPFPQGPERTPSPPSTGRPGDELTTPNPWWTYPTTAPTAGPSTEFPWPGPGPVPGLGPFPAPLPGPYPGPYSGYPVPPSENQYRTAPPATQPTPAPCTPQGTTPTPSTRPPCQPTLPTSPPVVYPTAPGYATSPAPTYPTAPPPTYPTAPPPTQNAYATVPETHTTAPYTIGTIPTLPTIVPTLPTAFPTLPTVGTTPGSNPGPGTSPCCYVELRNIQATVSCGTIGTKCCHQTCSNQRTITVSVPFPIFNLPSRIPCSEAVQRGIIREIDIQGVCNTFPEPTPYNPYTATAPTNSPVGTTGYPYPPSWPTTPSVVPTLPGATVTPGPPGSPDAYVVPSSSSGTLIGAFFTILIASILCL